MSEIRRQTRTGGRGASLSYIPGDFALSVGMPPEPTPPVGWRWTKLTDVARMESGHTPSRKHPEYWDGDIPWIGIKDAKAHHGRMIHDTQGHTNLLGIENSSARVLPAGTVCLSRTASVGYVVVMGREMATSQDFVSWICGKNLAPRFLQYLLIAEKNALLRFGTGAVHKTIYYPEVKAFHVCLPSLAEQKRIVAILDEAFEAIERAEACLVKAITESALLAAVRIDEVFSDPPEHWVRCKVGDVMQFKHGYAFKSEWFTDQGDRVLLTPGNYFESGGYRDRGPKQKYYNGEVPDGFTLTGGDLLLAMTEQAPGLLGAPLLVPNDGVYLHNQRLGLARPHEPKTWHAPFFFHFFNTSTFRAGVYRDASGVKVRHTSPKKMAALPIAFPESITEQQEWAARLFEMRDSCGQLGLMFRSKAARLVSLRQALLTAAFLGELRNAAVSTEREAAIA